MVRKTLGVQASWRSQSSTKDSATTCSSNGAFMLGGSGKELFLPRILSLALASSSFELKSS